MEASPSYSKTMLKREVANGLGFWGDSFFVTFGRKMLIFNSGYCFALAKNLVKCTKTYDTMFEDVSRNKYIVGIIFVQTRGDPTLIML